MVTTPSLKKYSPSVVSNQNGTVSVKYNPTEPGAHTLELSYAGVSLQDSPFKFHVDQVQPGRVSAYGPGLSSGLAGQPTSFTVVTKDAGPGNTQSTRRTLHCLSVSLAVFLSGPGLSSGLAGQPASFTVVTIARTLDQVTLSRHVSLFTACLSVCLSGCLSVCLPVCLSVCLSVCLCPFVCPAMYSNGA